MRDPEHAWSRRITRVAQEPQRVAKWARWFVTKQATTIGHELFVESDREFASTAFVVGSARSGTTWIAEVLSASPDTRFIMEPFDERCSQFRGGLPDATYLAPGAQNERLGFFADKVFTGQLRSKWTDQYNHAHHPVRRVVKDVRTVALLGWLTARYPEMPVVYVLRHPFATAWSMASLGWGAHGDLLRPHGRLDHLEPSERNLVLRQAFLAEVTRWCVEQSRGLRHLTPAIHVAYYESVVDHPAEAFDAMASYLSGRSGAWTGWQPDSSTFAKPSATSVRRTAPSHGAQWVESWQGQLDATVMDEAFDIVERFNLSDVYDLGSAPKIRADELWMRSAP
jgi:Sulfotransferase family